MPRRSLVAVLVSLGAFGCVGRLPPRDPAATLRVRVTPEGKEDANLRTFVARNFRIAPRPVLPSASLPLRNTGAGMVAIGKKQRGEPQMFVLQESGHSSSPYLTVFRVSFPLENEAGDMMATMDAPTAPKPPCESWVGFFVKGIGDRPRRPVVLSRWQNEGGSASIVIDPAQHMLPLRPVLRFSTREVKSLPNRKSTIILSLTAKAGAKPFLLLGLVRRPDGSYTEAVFRPLAQQLGWGGFVYTPGEDIEFSFYALDDSVTVRSPCRAG